jgi:hypothetical protein
LQSLDFLQDAAAGFRAQPKAITSIDNGADERKRIGDFEIVREVGRGGMGGRLSSSSDGYGLGIWVNTRLEL